MRRTGSRGLLGRPLRNEGGFTLIEVMMVAGISIAVIVAAAVAYQGTVLSWRGTAALLGLQRDASLACEMIQNHVRRASDIVISADGDSIRIFYDAGGVDSLAAVFYADVDGNIRDGNDVIISAGLDSLRFTTVGNAVNVDFVLEDDVGTVERTSDDQAIYMSSSAIRRN